MVALAFTDAELIRYADAVARLGVATRVRFVHVAPEATDPTTVEHGKVVGAMGGSSTDALHEHACVAARLV